MDVDIPRGKLVAVCGVSGSGKTSLAIDTLYAEGQRRYIESFSAYTRQFLERLEKPDYDQIDGLPPALAVRRGQTPRGNRSTVGTASETLEYLRLLFARLAELNCYQCGAKVSAQSPQTVANLIQLLPTPTKLMVGFEVAWQDVVQRAEVLAELQAAGFLRLVVGEHELRLGETEREQLGLLLPRCGTAWTIVDRLRGGDGPTRTTESLETAFTRGFGEIALFVAQMAAGQPSLPSALSDARQAVQSIDGSDWLVAKLSRRLACGACEIEYPEAEPRLFSFNSPLGACATCGGFGDTVDLDMQRIVPDESKSIRDGAIAPWSTPAYSAYLDELLDVAEEVGIPVDVPFKKLTKKHRKLLFKGCPQEGFEGLDAFFAWLERKKYKMHVRVFLSRWRSYNRCASCDGSRLNRAALAYRLEGQNFADLCRMQIVELAQALEQLSLSDHQLLVAKGLYESVQLRLKFLQDVGLGYLALDRSLRTLSGGEAQRTALTAALGSSLVNMLYVLDEPSVGLHPHDVQRLSSAIRDLTDRGNTVVMIEHEEALLEAADWLIEVGPAAGALGGEIVCSAPREEIASGQSLSVDYLSGKRFISLPAQRRATNRGWLEITGCQGNNLQNIDVKIPLGVLCLVTGVSGSGKSSLVQDTLSGALINRLSTARAESLPFESILGVGQLDACVLVDQNPISRSPRSNPVTYVKAFDEIRGAFAETIEAKTRNLTPGHFSFNSELGRCENCKGDGALQIDMQFLADVYVTCPACGGSRYRAEILRIKYRDRTIADVLDMTVNETRHFFRGAKKVQAKLQVLVDVGLGYLRLGQSAMTLSAGEAQRLKLATHLAGPTRRKCLFILDEPTTGLHTHDLLQLLDCFQSLIEAGHSLLVVEHNLHLIAAADYVIDMGPGPAHLGGRVVAAGTPEEIAGFQLSTTGGYLREFLKRGAG